MTTQEKLARLNELRVLNGKDPLKAWKQSGAKLDEAIATEEAAFNFAGTAAGDNTPKPMPLNEALTVENTNVTEGFEATDEELAQQTVRPTPAEVVNQLEAEAVANGKRPLSVTERAAIEGFVGMVKPETVKPKGKEKPSAGKFKTVRECAEHYLRENPEAKHADIAALVKGHFKDAKTTAASVAWYASKMKKKK